MATTTIAVIEAAALSDVATKRHRRAADTKSQRFLSCDD
jgi:hypothetical protein